MSNMDDSNYFSEPAPPGMKERLEGYVSDMMTRITDTNQRTELFNLQKKLMNANILRDIDISSHPDSNGYGFNFRGSKGLEFSVLGKGAAFIPYLTDVEVEFLYKSGKVSELKEIMRTLGILKDYIYLRNTINVFEEEGSGRRFAEFLVELYKCPSCGKDMVDPQELLSGMGFLG